MADFNVRADEVNVEQIMHQIRARIREKRGVDYTEEQIQELAKIKLEKFLDPKGVRSDLLEQFRQTAARDIPPRYEFDDQTLIRSANPLVAFIRRLFQPVLKLFFSPNPLVHALHVQTQINNYLLERAARDVLVYEVIHNLVVEMTRTGIDVKNMKMRVESIAGRLDFNERRARALEAVVQYKDGRDDQPRGGRGQGGRALGAEGQGGRGFAGEGPSRGEQGGRAFGAEGQGGAPGARAEQGPSAVDPMTGGESLRSRRRRRRRGRRSGPGFPSDERRGTNDELERRATSDEPERGGTNDEPEQRGSNDELERRATSDEPEGRGANDELEQRPTNEEPEQRGTNEAERRATSDEPEGRAPNDELERRASSDEPERRGASESSERAPTSDVPPAAGPEGGTDPS